MKLIATASSIAAIAVASVVIGGCGDSGASHAGPCGTTIDTGRQTSEGRPTVGMTAALLSATVDVESGAASDRCLPLRTGMTVHLHPGDRVQFLANGRPALTPASSRVVTVSTVPAALPPGPGDTRDQTGVMATLTAVMPGTVVAHWTSCSGTGC
jgi:hypothetical protein